MKKLIKLLCFIVIGLTSCNTPQTADSSQAKQSSTAQTDNNIVIGKAHSIQSKILNETRQIWVSLPESFTGDTNSKMHYPVIYLFDAPANFSTVASMIQYLSSQADFPEMIIVGITNVDRRRD